MRSPLSVLGWTGLVGWSGLALLAISLSPQGTLLGSGPAGWLGPSDHLPAAPSVDDSLRLDLDLPEQVRAGEEVVLTLRVESAADRTLDLYLTGDPPAFDLIVSDEQGDVVWRRLRGQVVTMVLRLETLAPGAVLTFSHAWDQRGDNGVPVAPGTFTVRGELLTEGDRLVSRTRTLRVSPGGGG
jgi:hypothetical protein